MEWFFPDLINDLQELLFQRKWVIRKISLGSDDHQSFRCQKNFFIFLHYCLKIFGQKKQTKRFLRIFIEQVFLPLYPKRWNWQNENTAATLMWLFEFKAYKQNFSIHSISQTRSFEWKTLSAWLIDINKLFLYLLWEENHPFIKVKVKIILSQKKVSSWVNIFKKNE